VFVLLTRAYWRSWPSTRGSAPPLDGRTTTAFPRSRPTH